VLLEAGAGGTTRDWDRVLPAVARFARVGRYDRAGLGRSDPRPAAPTLTALAADLGVVLGGPPRGGARRWVLVGHSRGAFIVRRYAALHPLAVAGLVLVDPGHEDAPDRLAALLEPEQARLLRARSTEVVRWREELRAAGPLPPVPLVVLSAGAPWSGRGAAPADWPWAAIECLGLHEHLAHLSPRGRRVTVPGSGHYIHEDRPDAVVGAIREVVEAARISPQRGVADPG
jgi:pimeloyl-ACP methyl ester carboxylesterase